MAFWTCNPGGSSSLRLKLNIVVLFISLCLTVQSQQPNDTPCSKQEDGVSCQAENVTVGGSATIKCNFHVDVNKTKHGFSVDTTPLSLPDTSRPKEILLCRWQDTVKLACNLQNGISFNYNVTDHMTVVIQQATEEFAGRYTCRTVPHDNRPVHACYLAVYTADTSTVRNQNGTSTEQPVNAGNSTLTCPSKDKEVLMIAVVVCLAILLAAAVVVVVFLIVSQKRSKNRSGRGQGCIETKVTTETCELDSLNRV